MYSVKQDRRSIRCLYCLMIVFVSSGCYQSLVGAGDDTGDSEDTGVEDDVPDSVPFWNEGEETDSLRDSDIVENGDSDLRKRTETDADNDTETGSDRIPSRGTDSDSHRESDNDTETDTEPEGTQCNGYLPESIFQERGQIADLAVMENTVYVAFGRGGLALYDNSGEIAEPKSRMDTGGIAISLATAPGYVYVLNAEAGLSVVDVSDVTAPKSVARTSPIERGSAVLISGNVISVLSIKGVLFFDVSEPSAPRKVGSLDIEGGVAMHSVGDTLYVGDSSGGIHAVSITDPTHPTIDKSVSITGEVRALFAEDERLYALNQDLLYVLDMDKSVNTAIESKTDLQGSLYDIHVVDRTAYVLMDDNSTLFFSSSNAHWTVGVVDVTNAGAPTPLVDSYCRKRPLQSKLFGTDSDLYIYTKNVIDTVSFDDASLPILSTTSLGPNNCTAVGMSDDYVYTYCNRPEAYAELVIFSTAGDILEAVGSLDLPETQDMHVSADHRYAYVLTDNAGLYVVDISTPAAPKTVSTFELTKKARRRLALSEQRAAVLTGDPIDSVWLADLTDPAAPRVAESGFERQLNSATAIALRENTLFISEWIQNEGYALTAFDVTDIAAPTVLTSLPFPNSLCQIIIDNGYLYGLSSSDLTILDVSNPGQPVLVSNEPIEDSNCWRRQMGLSNHRLYILNEKLVDVSNPASPIITEYSIGDTLFRQSSILVAGDRAVFSGQDASFGDAIVLTDLSDSIDLKEIAHTVTSETSVDIEVLEDYAYLLHPESLEVIDVEDPYRPVRNNRTALPFEARDMARNDHLLYVAASSSGLQIVDIADPAAPVLKGGIDIPPESSYWSVVVAADETHAYVGDMKQGLLVVNAMDPDAPFIEARVSMTANSIADIKKDENTLHLIYNGTWFVFDVTNPLTPVLLYEKYDVGLAKMALIDNLMYLNNHSHGFIFDVSNPASPVLINTFPVSSDWRGGPLLPNGDTLFVGNHPIDIFDIADPTAPFSAGHLPFPSTGHVVGTISDGTAYFAAENLMIVDVRAPFASAPGFASTRSEPILSLPAANEVEWYDDKVVVLSDGFLSLFDVTEPTSPQEQGRIPIRRNNLRVSDGLAFVSDDFVMNIIDIASTSAPNVIGRLITNRTNMGHLVEKRGDIVYVVFQGFGLATYDLSDMSSPKLIDTLEIPGIGSGVVTDDRLYISVYSQEIHSVDISNPAALRMSTMLPIPIHDVYQAELAIEGDLLLTMTQSLNVFDISDPDAPTPLGELNDFIGNIESIAMKNGIAYVVTNNNNRSPKRLSLISMESPESPVLIGHLRPRNGVEDLTFDDNGNVYIADRTGQFHVWDTKSLVHPPLESDVLMESGVADIERQNGELFVRTKDGQVLLIDTSADIDSRPKAFSIVGKAMDISVEEDLYVLCEDGNIHAMDTTNPNAPPLEEAAPESVGREMRLFAQNGLVLTQSWFGEISIMERTSAGIEVCAQHRLSAFSHLDMALSPSFQEYVVSDISFWNQKAAIVSTTNNSSTGNLTVLDLGTPSLPSELSSIVIHGRPSSTAMQGDYLFISTSSSAPLPIGSTYYIHVWNLIDPSLPVLEAVIPFDSWIADMNVTDDRLIVAQPDQGISVFDTTSPETPVLLTEVRWHGGASKVLSDGDRAFFVTKASALVSVRVDACLDAQYRHPSIRR